MLAGAMLNELAVNEMTTRRWLELQHNLDSTDKLLLDAPRNAGDTDRPCLQFAGRTAVRFCGTVSGADDAVLLAKAAGIAMQTVAVERERKHVRA
jgi:hypothetical protein